MVPQPEQQARNTIDQLLAAAGWSVCDAAQANVHAARSISHYLQVETNLLVRED